MKLLILGAGSFSGAAFSDYATRAGHSVVGLRRIDWDINTDSRSHIAGWVGRGFDVLVNFIALNMVAESWGRAGDYYRTNIEGVARLAEALRDSGIRKFVQISTPEVYGTMHTFLKESARFNPSTPYAVSRAAADTHLQLLHREHGFPVCFTRTVNVYGPGQQSYRIIPKTIACIMRGEKLPLHGGGVSTRSFLHIQDVARAILRVCEDGVPGETYHAAHPTQTSIRSLVVAICERMGVAPADVIEDVAERPGKDMAYQLDDSKIRSALGWSETISLEQGLDDTIEWFRRNPPAGSLDYQHREIACA